MISAKERFDLEFKDKIKALRLEIGATLEEIGNAVGVSKATVKRWESGEIANIRRDKIYKLAVALRTTPSYLMGWDEEDPTPVSGRQPTRNTIKIAGRDGSFVERELTDDQLTLMKNMLDQLKPIDDERI